MTEPMSAMLAVLLGALQGVAEFLPISSSGHLAVAQAWLGIDAASGGHTFNIVVHAGTLGAVMVFYRNDLKTLAQAWLWPRDVAVARHSAGESPTPEPLALADDLIERSSTRLGPDVDLVPSRVGPRLNTARALGLALVLGTLPLVVALTPFAEAVVVHAESDMRWLGAAFLATAALLTISHRPDPSRSLTAPRPWQALVIGAAQLLAVMPGISRSGSTIAAGLMLGLGRLTAARFSFLLAIPAILGASTKEAIDLWRHGIGSALDPISLVLGFGVSFLVGTLTLQALMRLIVRVGLWPFVPYLAGLGLFLLVRNL